jgi:hypothetical protein
MYAEIKEFQLHYLPHPSQPSLTPSPPSIHPENPKNIARNKKTGLTEHVPDSLGQCCDFEAALPGANIALALELFEGVWIVHADG